MTVAIRIDMTGITDPATGLLPPTTSGTGSGKVNGGDGTLSGYEISATLPFNVISESLDGFGIIASYTGIKSDMKDQNDNEYQLPGLSDSISSVKTI